MSIQLIDKIAPYNGAFRGMVDAEQLVGTAGSFGVNFKGTGTGFKGYRPIPFDMTITGWTMTANAVGDVVVDVKACAIGSLPTTVSLIGGGGVKPTLSSAQSNSDTTLTDWTTALAAGDVVEFYVDSISGVTNVTLDVQYERAIIP